MSLDANDLRRIVHKIVLLEWKVDFDLHPCTDLDISLDLDESPGRAEICHAAVFLKGSTRLFSGQRCRPVYFESSCTTPIGRFARQAIVFRYRAHSADPLQPEEILNP